MFLVFRVSFGGFRKIVKGVYHFLRVLMTVAGAGVLEASGSGTRIDGRMGAFGNFA